MPDRDPTLTIRFEAKKIFKRNGRTLAGAERYSGGTGEESQKIREFWRERNPQN
jgi:hypothetical protein